MLRGRRFVDILGHWAWTFVSTLIFRVWLHTGVRPRYLSSKGQDRWIVTKIFPGLRHGFFVEIGAGNGFIGSDSFVLENDFGWSGICVEPNPNLFQDLTTVVRRRCICVDACIDRTPGTIEFALAGDTSGIVAEDTDNSVAVRGARLQRLRAAGMTRPMASTTIAQVLDAADAPSVIHYFSLDVEGAEERVLSSFPFDRYRVLAITVERPTRPIHELLAVHGLALQRQKWHDGFYVQRELLNGPEVTPDFSRKQF